MRLQSQRADDIGNFDKNVAAPAPATRFVLVLEPMPGIDAIRTLRFILNWLLRRCGMRCVALREICDTAAAVLTPLPCAQTPGDRLFCRRRFSPCAATRGALILGIRVSNMPKLSVSCHDFRPLVRNTLRGFATIAIADLKLIIRDVALHERAMRAGRRAGQAAGQRW